MDTMYYGPTTAVNSTAPIEQQQGQRIYPQFVPQQMQNIKENVSFKPVDQVEQPNVEIDFSGLTKTEIIVHKPVGLDMNSLIKNDSNIKSDNTDTKEDENNYPNFNYFYKPIPDSKIPKMFSVHPIPDASYASMLPKPVQPEDSHINKQAPLNSTVGRKLNNWFTRLLEQRGEDYIRSGKLTVDEVSRNAERILDDMIAGKIDYTKQGSYIIEPVIIETLVNYCYNKLAINKAIQFSLGYVYNDYSGRADITDSERLKVLYNIDDALSRNITQSMAIVNQDIGIYEVLYSKLYYVMMTKNVSSLFSLTNELNTYRKAKMKRY